MNPSTLTVLSRVEAFEWVRGLNVKLSDLYGYFNFVRAREAAVNLGHLAAPGQVQVIIDEIDETEERGGTFQEWKEQLRDERLSTKIPRVFTEITLEAFLQVWYQTGRCFAFKVKKGETGRRAVAIEYLAVNACKHHRGHARFYGKVLSSDHPWWQRNFLPDDLGRHCVAVLSDHDGASHEGVTEKAVSPGWDFSVCHDGPMSALKKEMEALIYWCDNPRPRPSPSLLAPRPGPKFFLEGIAP